jgi:hypothetical protein
MPKLKKEEIAKRIATKTYSFLNKELVDFIKENSYEENGDAIFAVACATAAFSADLLDRATDLEAQEIFGYLTDALAGSLNIELEYLNDDDDGYGEEEEEEEEEEEPVSEKTPLPDERAVTDKKLWN